ncbi:MAG: MBL fold metallo-hydrolase, partial [Gemmatimonadetes bacterium]|nr:MBL fold metallo-hydrolase [Gemmatimonadota bacterium]
MTAASEWTPRELNARIERGDEFFILDIRNRDEFEAGPIEGRKPLPQRNVPYFEILEASGDGDLVESFAKYARTELSSELPIDREILAVCAKGGTSEFMAQALRRLGYNATNLVGGMAAWGNHYQIKTVTDTRTLQIFQVQRPGRGCLSYVVVSDGHAAVVDPLRHIEHYIELAGEHGFAIDRVLDTHGHADHVSGASALAERLNVPYHLHPYDGIHPLDVLPARIPFEFVKDGSRLTVGRAQLEVLHIPGHTLGNTALLLDGQFLLSGDSIFI